MSNGKQLTRVLSEFSLLILSKSKYDIGEGNFRVIRKAFGEQYSNIISYYFEVMANIKCSLYKIADACRNLVCMLNRCVLFR